jgi:hypothetical protein
MSNNNEPTGKIEYIENHMPGLPAGDYEIDDARSIKSTKPSLSKNSNEPFPNEQKEGENEGI